MQATDAPAAATTDSFDCVSEDPAAWYNVPQDIVDDPALSHAEKQRLLVEWALDVEDRSGAADEGMVPETAELVDRDMKLVAGIAAARAALDGLAPENTAPSFGGRLWRRISGKS